MSAVTVDLSLAQTPNSDYAADLHVMLPESTTTLTPLAAPVLVHFDQQHLHSLALDPAAYGTALSSMLFASQPLRTAFAQARAVTAQHAIPLRLRFLINPNAEELHRLHWECLTDPEAPAQPLAASTQVLLARVLPSTDWQQPPKRAAGSLRALALIAAPRDLPEYGLAPIDAVQEIAHARIQLAQTHPSLLGETERATLPALVGRLHTGYDVLFVLAHGRCDEHGQTWIYLEDETGQTAPIPGDALATQIAALVEKPQLVILGCCESADDGNSATLAALGPQLVQAGVPAVLAMLGRVSRTTLAQLLPAVLQALQEDARIDRAVAQARCLVRDRPDWWVPVLWMRPSDGRLWHPAPVAQTMSAATQALHQLRAPVADFVGRDETLARLVTALRTGSAGRTAAISGVRGMGGIGKSELAYAVAAQLRADYPDAQLLLELGGASDTPLPPAQALQQIIRAFRPEDKLPEELSALQALYRSVLADQRTLILADDARDAAQVRPLLPPPGCALLVTSRQRFALDGMTAIDLGRLDEAAAVALLCGICDRLSEEQARQIARLCGYLPLALRVSAGILLNDEALSVARYLHQLADKHQRLAQLRDPDDPTRDVEANLLLSYAALDTHSQTLFRRLGVLAADADIELVAALLELSEDQADAVLRTLLRRSLVEYDRTRGRWDLHDLVRTCALDLLTRANEERATRLHYAEQVIRLIQQADQHYQAGGAQVLDGLALFDREQAHLEAVRAWLWVAPPSPDIDRLLIAEAEATTNIGFLRDPLRTVRAGQLERALAAAQRQSHRVAEGRLLNILGNTYRELGDLQHSVASFEQALLIAREQGDRHAEGQALGELGNVYLSQGEARRALDFYQQHLLIAQATGDRRGAGRAIGNIGNAYWALGEVQQAVGYLEQWVQIARELGDRQREGRALGNLGTAFHVLGDVRQALECYQQALTIAHELGDRQEQGRTLGNIGEAHGDSGDLTQALAHYDQALPLLREVGDQRNEAYILSQSSRAHLRQGQPAAALAQCNSALTLIRAIGDRRMEGAALQTLADAHATLGHPREADMYYAEALAILDALGCVGEAAHVRWAYGLFLHAQGAGARSLTLMERCIAYEQQIGHPQAAEHAALLTQLREEVAELQHQQ